MKKDKKIELLELVKKALQEDTNNSTYNTGICQVLLFLCLDGVFTQIQHEQLKAVLRRNKPKDDPNNLFYEFTQNKYWKKRHNYWWQPMYLKNQTKEIRIAYIDKLISTFK